MFKYVGIKLIEAEPAYKVVGACQQVQIVPADGVQKSDLPQCAQEGYKVRYKDGYESWSPKEAFEEAYRDVGELTFPMALAMLQQGALIARRSWDGIDANRDWWTQRYIFLEKGYPDGVRASEQLSKASGVPEGQVTYHEPYIHLCAVSSNTFEVWTPSTHDMFATDWYVVKWPEAPIKG